MNYEWLTAQAFERAHAIVGAINTLSIHTKLVLAHRIRPAEAGDVTQARQVLVDFVGILERAVEDAEHDRDRVALGVDPRLALLAQQLVSLRQRRPSRSSLSETPFAEMRSMLSSPSTADSSRLLTVLADLRQLVESHAYADIVEMLGEL